MDHTYRYRVHSKTRTFVQLGILLGLSGDSGDGMEGGGGGGGGGGRWDWGDGGGAVLCINPANQMHKGLYRCFLLKYPSWAEIKAIAACGC